MKDSLATPEITSKYVIKAQATKPTMVNLAFIRSGEQFAAAKALSSPAPLQVARPRSSSERLAQFYHDTQQAVAKAQRHRSSSLGETPLEDSQDVTCMSVINLDYLRSGFQFESAPLHSNQAPDQPPKTDSERLRGFYVSTSQAMEAATNLSASAS
eukprot:m.15723 g.15723  ORF g.15723 m.15723 type:complete len:156 (+) comp10509_c0_seq1:152-619(+)